MHAENLHDVGSLARSRERPSAFVALGDWNADIAPIRLEGGARETEEPMTSEQEAVLALAESLGSRVIRPSSFLRGPGPVGISTAPEAPQVFSRRPQGLMAA